MIITNRQAKTVFIKRNDTLLTTKTTAIIKAHTIKPRRILSLIKGIPDRIILHKKSMRVRLILLAENVSQIDHAIIPIVSKKYRMTPVL